MVLLFGFQVESAQPSSSIGDLDFIVKGARSQRVGLGTRAMMGFYTVHRAVQRSTVCECLSVSVWCV